MHRRLILTVILFSITTSPFAQTSIGIGGGLSYNTYNTNIANRAATALSGEAGFAFEIPFRYKILTWLYAIAAPGFLQKSYSLNRTDSLAGEYDQHNNTYVQFSIGISPVYEWRRFQIHLDAGPFTGYWLYGRVKGRTADIFNSTTAYSANGQTSQQYGLSGYNQQYSFVSRRDNRLEAGWWLGPGLQYRLAGSRWLTAAAKYFQSFTSQEKMSDSPIPAYNRTWTFTVGVLWAVSKLK